MKSTHFTAQRMHLVTLQQQNITFWYFEAILGVNLQYTAGPIFEINGHGASVWSRYNVFH